MHRQGIKTKTYPKRQYGWSERRYTAVRTARTAKRRRRSFRTATALGIEQKYLDVWTSDITIPAPTDASGAEMQPEGGCTGCLSAPAQGDGEQNRDGRKITIKSCFVNVTVRGAVSADQADVKAAPQVFVALVQDMQANGATIVSENVFTNPNDTAYVNTYPLRNMQYSSRYRVLDHKTLDTGPTTASTDGANTTSIINSERTCTLSWRGEVPVTFTGTTADVASVADNAFHIIAYSTTTNFVPVISYTSRIRFVG